MRTEPVAMSGPGGALVLVLLLALVAQLAAQLRATMLNPQLLTRTGKNADDRLRAAVNGDQTHFDEVLKNILIPRVVGTRGHQKVKQYIKKEMKRLGWNVQTDSFLDVTPNFGRLRFENIIAQLNPRARRVMVLACHYDSKYFPDFAFLGATDSAVPCSMLINLARSLQAELSSLKSEDLSLEMWFFDGEEAFQQWGPKDSLYGARHLAEMMEKDGTLNRIVSSLLVLAAVLSLYPTMEIILHKNLDLQVLVLLDLIGAAAPSFVSYFPESENHYRTLLVSEQSLLARNHLKGVNRNDGVTLRNKVYFQPLSYPSHVEDDHTPFLKRGVPILHIIPAEFPKVWHKKGDDKSAIDPTTVNDLNMILRHFVLQSFDL